MKIGRDVHISIKIFHIKLEVLEHARKKHEDDLSIFPAQVSCKAGSQDLASLGGAFSSPHNRDPEINN